MRAMNASPGGEAHSKIRVEADFWAPHSIQRSRERSLPPSTPRRFSLRGRAGRGSGARTSQAQCFAREMSGVPDASQLISAFEQQLGAPAFEGLAQQQLARPEICAKTMHAGADWPIGWSTTSAARKQARMRHVISGLGVSLRFLMDPVSSMKHPRALWPQDLLPSIVTFPRWNANCPLRPGRARNLCVGRQPDPTFLARASSRHPWLSHGEQGPTGQSQIVKCSASVRLVLFGGGKPGSRLQYWHHTSCPTTRPEPEPPAM